MRVGLLPRLYQRHGSCPQLRNCKSSLLLPRYPKLSPLPRHITCTKHLGQDDRPGKEQAQTQIQLRSEQSESIKPESYQEAKKARPDDTPKTDALLSEQTLSNKEQRKADWAIMKEMARYLWPKVGLADTSDATASLKDM